MRVFFIIKKRVVTKVLSTGALEASVSRFDSDLPDTKYNWIETYSFENRVKEFSKTRCVGNWKPT